jgi:hypothetical protein
VKNVRSYSPLPTAATLAASDTHRDDPPATADLRSLSPRVLDAIARGRSPDLTAEQIAEARAPMSAALESVTMPCPIKGCEWTLHLPRVAGAEPNTFVFALAALELLAHVVGRYGENGRTPHEASEVAALGAGELVGAAFPDFERNAAR